MKLVIFVGPTLGAGALRERLDADVRPPASFGDVYRAARSGAETIALIDGYFDRVAATWHKEILWAMSEGVHVFGAASMGALRAAELAEFGMIGVGEIFRAFHGGELEDDDEVAVAHGDASVGYAAVSDAMVNIRATLRHAQQRGVLSADAVRALELSAKRRFYPERSFRALLHDAEAAGLSPQEARQLGDFLERGRYDAKRADAEQLVHELAQHEAERPGPKRVSYRFNATDAWHQATRLAERGRTPASDAPEFSKLLSDIEVSADHDALRAGAIARGAALDLAMTAGVRPDPQAIRAAAEELCRRLGLSGPAELERWCAREGLDEAGARRFFEAQARLAWSQPLMDELAARHLADHLRAIGGCRTPIGR